MNNMCGIGAKGRLPLDKPLKWFSLWRGSREFPSEYATMACRLFWAEGNWDPVGSRESWIFLNEVLHFHNSNPAKTICLDDQDLLFKPKHFPYPWYKLSYFILFLSVFLIGRKEKTFLHSQNRYLFQPQW